jgi:hypothetical protein
MRGGRLLSGEAWIADEELHQAATVTRRVTASSDCAAHRIADEELHQAANLFLYIRNFLG